MDKNRKAGELMARIFVWWLLILIMLSLTGAWVKWFLLGWVLTCP